MKSDKYRKIFLRELFYSVLFKWRWILCWGVAAMALMTAARYGMNLRAQKNTGEELGSVQNSFEYMDMLSDEELYQCYDIYNRIISLYQHQEYLQNSLLVKMSPYNVAHLSMVYAVDADGEESSELSAVYVVYLSSSAFLQSAVENLHMEIKPKYLSEVMEITNDSNIIIIDYYDDSPAECEKMADIIATSLSDYCESVRQTLGMHSLTLVSQEVKPQLYYEAAEIAFEGYPTVDNLYAKINELTVAQKRLVCSWLEEETTEVDQSFFESMKDALGELSQEVEGSGSIFRMMFTGALLGLILSCGYFAVKYTSSDCIHNEDDLRLAVGEDILGIVEVERYFKGMFASVDRYVRKKERHNAGNRSFESQVELLYIKLLKQIGSLDIKRCILLSTKADENCNSVCNSLEEKLKNDIKVKCEAAESAKWQEWLVSGEMVCVIFVERSGVSRFYEIQKLANSLRDVEVGLISGVLVD